MRDSDPSVASEGDASSSNEYQPDNARTRFNTGWDSIAVLDVTPDFTDEYDQMLLLALRKHDASDACVMVVFDDCAAVKPEINAALYSLKFK